MPFSPEPDALPQIDAYLDAMLGTGAAFELGLLTGDPRVGGVEVTGPGYARVAGVDDGTFWQAAADGIKSSFPQEFPAPTGEWDTATHEGRWFGGVLVDFAPLDSKVVVTSASSPAPVVRVSRKFNGRLI